MTTIFAHHDADGVTSAYFAKKHYTDANIKIVEKFGDTSEWKDGDIMVDMRPDNPNIKGTVYDHHFPHPPHKYDLIPNVESPYISVVPATYITWNEFKDEIPKEDWWKIVIGLGGDGQEELVPPEVYALEPTLLLIVNTYTQPTQKYGNWSIPKFPLYRMLSSSINSLCRIAREDPEQYDVALQLMEETKKPIDLYKNPLVRDAKSKAKLENRRIIQDADYEFFNHLTLVLFESKYRMTGYVASAIGSEMRTVLAIDTTNNSASLRGKLSLYYREKLNSSGLIKMDGHAGFMGGRLLSEPKELVKWCSKELI